MKDFDLSRSERREHGEPFTIGGESFLTSGGGNPDDLVRLVTVSEGENLPEVVAQIDEAILSMISPSDDGHGRYRMLRGLPSSDPRSLSLADMRELVEWLIEAQTARPTSSPTDSSGGQETAATGTTSTEGSSSEGSPEAQAA